MRTCKFRDSHWRADHRCFKRGIVLGVCIDHLLERCRWDLRLGFLRLSVDLSMINRPRLHWDECRPISWVSLDYGNGNSDPAFSVGWERPPAVTDETEVVA